MLTIELSRTTYSEAVMRKALYWCSPNGEWTLNSVDDHWVIDVENPNSFFESQLHKHLNDFLLREKLDKQTAHLRDEIVTAALRAVRRNVGIN